MWKAYSLGYLRRNRTGNAFIRVISLTASMLLSMLSGVFYNFWMDQVSQAVAATGAARVETTPAIVAYLVIFSFASLALIMMIHHTFAATMNQRIHQLGILQSVGATPRQIKRALTLEVLTIAAPAILLGNLIGILLSWGFIRLVLALTEGLRAYSLRFVYSPLALAGSVGFSLLTAFLSARLPARHMSRLSPMEAIQGRKQTRVGRVRRYRLFSRVCGVYAELARKSLYARRRAMRVGTVSVFLAVFSCVALLNVMGISNLSTQKTYFDRFRDKWDFLITAPERDDGLMRGIRALEGVAGCSAHRVAVGEARLPESALSDEAKRLGLENLNSAFSLDEDGRYCVKALVYVLDDESFSAWRGRGESRQAVAVNLLWDSLHSKRTERRYVPFLNQAARSVEVNGCSVALAGFARELPPLREEFRQYALSLVMSESAYHASGLTLPLGEAIYTVHVRSGEDYAAVGEELRRLVSRAPVLALEGRIEEVEREKRIQQGLRVVIFLLTGLLACVGLVNLFASSLGQLQQRKREFARYFSVGMTPKGAAKMLAWEAGIVAFRPILWTVGINIPMVAVLLDVGGISAREFVAERLPLAPALMFFTLIVGAVAAAYAVGGWRICGMELAESVRDDTLMM